MIEYYLLENGSGGTFSAGLVGAIETTEENIKLLAKKYGSNIIYRKVTASTFETAKDELKIKDEAAAKMRFGARSLELATRENS